MSALLKKSFLIGKEITFGRYQQSADPSDGMQKIRWIVLAREGEKVLLLSKYGLDTKPYHSDYGNMTWEGCDLRKWLNNDFINTAFTKEEQEAILTTRVNSENDVEDKIFFLSHKEAWREYFTDDESRICRPTAYAASQETYNGTLSRCWWWLRSPSINRARVACVSSSGYCLNYNVLSSGICIRPALWINLNSAEFKKYQIQEMQFGKYKKNIRCKEAIQWQVLARDGEKALLLSRYGLDVGPYHSKCKDMTWEECDLRKWLNTDFLNFAFTKEEQKAILVTTVDNSWRQGCYGYDVSSGNDTEDKVFLLSHKEAFETFFTEDIFRLCQPTAYAKRRYFDMDLDENCFWWLRSSGFDRDVAACVYDDGSRSDDRVDYEFHCIRPALWVNLNSDVFN